MTLRPTALVLAAAIAPLFAPAAARQAVSLLGNGYLSGGSALVPVRREMPLATQRAPFIAARSGAADSARSGPSALRRHRAREPFRTAPAPRTRPRPGRGLRHRPQPRRRARLSSACATCGPGRIARRRLRRDQLRREETPGRRPTEMTLGEVYAWIDASPGQPHAIGRFAVHSQDPAPSRPPGWRRPRRTLLARAARPAGRRALRRSRLSRLPRSDAEPDPVHEQSRRNLGGAAELVGPLALSRLCRQRRHHRLGRIRGRDGRDLSRLSSRPGEEAADPTRQAG